MPNWCENWIEFTGNTEQVSKLASLIMSPVKEISSGALRTLSFDQPPWEYGEPFISDIKPGGSIMSRTLGFLDKSKFDYITMVKKLGTKWDFDLEDIVIEGSRITAYADTAWSPPMGWFELVCKKYSLEGELSSGEAGNNFGCILSVKDNQVQIYGSEYNYWSCLNYDSHDVFKNEMLELNNYCPDLNDSLHDESQLWPKTWAEYKERFLEGITQL